MFRSVQAHQHKMNLNAKKCAFDAGMVLAKGENMIKRFTYKELTIIIGIIVAMVIVFAFLWPDNNATGESFNPVITPKVETSSIEHFTRKVMAQILATAFR